MQFQDEIQKHKEKKESKEEVLGSKMLIATQVEGSEHKSLLGLVDSGSSKTLVNGSAMQRINDMKISKSKKVK